MLQFKLLILVLAVLIIAIYLHIIIKNKENFIGDINDQPISIQLLGQIAAKLGVSVRRIQNLIYNGDVATQILSVSFTILDPNVIEVNNGEKNAQTVANNAYSLFVNNNFIVKINNINVRLSKTNSNSNNSPTATLDNSVYFNNTGLLDISNYSQQKYIQVPNDPSMTHFYSLKMDSNFNLKPVLF
jgi:hypothetical protein